jgi:hypothetical protein
LDNLSRLGTTLQEADSALEAYVASKPEIARLRNYYQLLPGYGPINSLTVVLEGQDLSRFPAPKALMSFVGLIPGKWQSGGKDPILRITKAGNKYLRTALVGAARFYADSRMLKGTNELEQLPAELAEFIQRCQKRLNGRYRHLIAKKKHSNKAKVAVAREMCGFVWEFYTHIIPVLEEQGFHKAA